MIELCTILCGACLVTPNCSNVFTMNSSIANESMAINQTSSAPVNVLSEELFENLKTVHSFASLSEGWNGYDAPAFSKDQLEFVSQILIKLFKQPEVFPTARCSIQLEYEKANGDYLEFEIFDQERIEMFLQTKDHEIEEIVSVDKLLKKVGEFYG